MSGCEHEWERYPTEMIVVSDEEFYAHPFRDWAPPRIVPCLRCGAPLDRGRYDRMISIPALRLDWPFGRDEEDDDA
jgi:hypothetical protein